jgi:hypothetical protein
MSAGYVYFSITRPAQPKIKRPGLIGRIWKWVKRIVGLA